MRSIFGLAPDDEDLTLPRFLAAIHPDDLEATQNAFMTALANNTEFDREYRIVWPDGTVRWIVARGHGEYAADGAPQFDLSASRNRARFPAYARLDGRLERAFVRGDRRLTLFAEVLNVLNRANYGPGGAGGATPPQGRDSAPGKPLKLNGLSVPGRRDG